MKKLLILLLVILIFGTISASVADEWEKAKKTCAKVKQFLKDHGLYDVLVDLVTKGLKKSAIGECKKKLPEWLCEDIVTVLGKLTSKIKIC